MTKLRFRGGFFNQATGFSLVEILVVVTILVILSAIAVPIFVGQKDKAVRGVTMTKVAVVASVLANAYSTGGAAVVEDGGVSDGFVTSGMLYTFHEFSDVSPFTSIMIGSGVSFKVNGGVSVVDGREVVESFCVQGEGEGGVQYHMENMKSEPLLGLCP